MKLNFSKAFSDFGRKQLEGNTGRVFSDFLCYIPTGLILPVPYEFGDLYQASIRVTSPTGMSRQVLTVWMVRFGEEVARFVTAVPDRKRRQS